MRIAAGVILIIAAIFNIGAGTLYMGAGGATTYVAANSDEINSSLSNGTGGTVTVIDDQASTDMMTGGGLMAAFGIFVLISVGILIAGAVFLFMNKKAGFVIAAGIMALIVEGGGMAYAGFGVTNLFGLIGGILAIIAARSMSTTAPAAASAE